MTALKKSFLATACVQVLFLTSFDQAHAALSAYRSVDQSYKSFKDTAARTAQAKSSGLSAAEMAKPFAELQLPIVTEWPSLEAAVDLFERVRDYRFLQSPHDSDFLRRTSWLYPDDGCFTRAAMAIMNLTKVWGAEPTFKVFAFGNLRVTTKNSPRGETTWWYHVAPIFQVGEEYFVLDPAIRPDAPMTLTEWLGSMSPNIDQVEVAICQAGTYLPHDDCNLPFGSTSEKRAYADQPEFLHFEWHRLLQLGRRPEAELGEYPPWR